MNNYEEAMARLTPEQRRKLDAMAQEEREKVLREIEANANPNEKKLKIEVETNSQAVKELAQENAELKQQVVSGKLEIAKDVTDRLVEKYAEYGLSAPRLDTKEDFDKAVEILKRLREVKHEAPSGQAPLNEAQLGKSRKGYDSYEEMIDDLRFREKSSDKMVSSEAHEILNALLGRAMKKVAKEDRKMPEFEEPLPELKEVGNLKVRSNTEDDPFDLKRKFRERERARKGEFA